VTELVTGGAGYFGSRLAQQLLESGESVRIFDLISPDDQSSLATFCQGDIRNYDQVRQACEQVDVVYHCVAQVPLASDKESFRSVNIQGTEILLRACLDAGVGKVVLLSSSAVYGIPSKNPVDNAVLPKPVEDYGRAKLEAELLARRYVDEHGLDITIIRPRTILGHGRLGIFQVLFDWVELGHNIYVLGRGDNIYQFVHADDLADACIKAGQRPGFATYNIGAEKYGTMRETLEGLAKYAGTGSHVRSLPMKPAVFAMRTLSALQLAPFAPYHWMLYGSSLYFDLAGPMQELNWQPKWGNIDMICQSYDWYLEHKEEIRDSDNASAHRSPVRQGLLLLLKRLS
jgi:nucleoside-diphosphate-sugar epimerase